MPCNYDWSMKKEAPCKDNFNSIDPGNCRDTECEYYAKGDDCPWKEGGNCKLFYNDSDSERCEVKTLWRNCVEAKIEAVNVNLRKLNTPTPSTSLTAEQCIRVLELYKGKQYPAGSPVRELMDRCIERLAALAEKDGE